MWSLLAQWLPSATIHKQTAGDVGLDLNPTTIAKPINRTLALWKGNIPTHLSHDFLQVPLTSSLSPFSPIRRISGDFGAYPRLSPLVSDVPSPSSTSHHGSRPLCPVVHSILVRALSLAFNCALIWDNRCPVDPSAHSLGAALPSHP